LISLKKQELFPQWEQGYLVISPSSRSIANTKELQIPCNRIYQDGVGVEINGKVAWLRVILSSSNLRNPRSMFCNSHNYLNRLPEHSFFIISCALNLFNASWFKHVSVLASAPILAFRFLAYSLVDIFGDYTFLALSGFRRFLSSILLFLLWCCRCWFPFWARYWFLHGSKSMQ
jgi:hypothetical protein